MSKPLIGVSYPGVTGKLAEKIRQMAAQFDYDVKIDKGVPDEWFEDCAIIFGYPKPAKVAGYRGLRWLQSSASGIEKYMEPGILPESVLFTNAAGGYGNAIAEHVLGQLLMLYKRSIEYYGRQKESDWCRLGAVQEVEGSVITLVGFGDLGQSIAKRLQPFGAVTRAVKRTEGQKPNTIHQLYTTAQLDQALEGADTVILCAPETPETLNLLNRERIFSLKKGATLINVARASLLDQEALYEALREGRLGGASLDVFTPEPLPSDSPFWALPNVIITPHIAGGLANEKNVENVVNIFLTNLEAYATGAPLIHVVDRQRKY